MMGYYVARSSKTKELQCATLMDERGMVELGKFLSENFSEIAYRGITKDETNIRFSSLDDLLSYPNFDKRNLVGLDIECKSTDKSLDVNFREDRFIRPDTIRYTLQYDNAEWGYSFENELNERLKGFKPWYNILTFTNLTLGLPVMGSIIALLIFGIDFWAKQLGYLGFLSIDYSAETGNQIVGYIMVIPILIISFLINKLRDYLFPLMFIAIGKQKERYRMRQKIAYLLFGVIGLSVIINIFSSYFMK